MSAEPASVQGTLAERSDQLKCLSAQVADLEAGVRVRDVRIGDLSAELASVQGILADREAAARARDASIGDLERAIEEREAYIQQIHSGHAWRLVTQYFKFRERLLPQGTKRRLFAKKIFHTFLSAADVWERIRKTIIRRPVNLRSLRSIDRKNRLMNNPLAHRENTAKATLRCYRSALEHVATKNPLDRWSKRMGILEQFRTPPPTILIVTHVRFYRPAAGNELRISNLIKFLKKRGYRIAVIVNPLREKAPLDREGRRKIHEFVDYYEEVGDFDSDPIFSTAYGQPLTTEPILEGRRQQEQAFCPDAVLLRTSELIKQFSPQVVIAEYIWTSSVLKLAPAGTLRVIDLIDMFSSKAKNVNRFGFDDALAISPDEEKAFLNRADLAIAIQDAEAAAFRELEPTCRVITAGVDFDVATLTELSEQVGNPPVVLIVASNNPFNVRCVQEFTEQAWPSIRKQVPHCILRIVGKVCHSLVSRGQGLELIPYAADLTKSYRQATVVVNPVYAGTGLKVKSVETLGHGRALVSWPEGVAGIPSCTDTPYVVSNSWPEMATQVVHILTDSKFRHSLCAKAREFALVNLSAEVVYRELAAHLDLFCEPRPKQSTLDDSWPCLPWFRSIRVRRALPIRTLASQGPQKKPEQRIE